MTGFDFRQLQAEQAPWVLHNFGDRPSWMPLMGVVEELGEMVEAATRRDHDAMKDGIADCIIFMADYCTAMDWSLQALWDSRQMLKGLNTGESSRRLMVAAGKMQHHHLKLHQGIRGDRQTHEEGGKEAARWILAELVWIYPFFPNRNGRERNDVQAEAVVRAVEETWAEVRKRDWKKNPKGGSGGA